MKMPSLTRLLRGDFANRLETRRFYADRGQSRDFVSYAAIEGRFGGWHLYFCNYVPEGSSGRARPDTLEPTTFTLQAYGEAAPYRVAASRLRQSPRMTRAAAIRALHDHEDRMLARGATAEDSLPPHDRHFSVAAAAEPAAKAAPMQRKP